MAEASESHFQQLRSQFRVDLSSGNGAATLPERVIRAIAARADASEVLIKIIQLVIVVLFGVLYALAPKTDAGTAFSPVPFVLAFYLAANLFGLACRSRPGSPIGPSISRSCST